MQTEGFQVNDRELMTAVKSKLCELEFSTAQRQQSINKAVEWQWVFKTDKNVQRRAKGDTVIQTRNMCCQLEVSSCIKSK